MTIHQWNPFTHIDDVRVVAHLVVLRCDHDGCQEYIVDANTARLKERAEAASCWEVGEKVGEKDYCLQHGPDEARR